MRKTQLTSCFVIVGLLSASQFAGAADPAHSDQPSVAPTEAISKLKEGNGRYTSGNLQHPGQTAERRMELAKIQHPFVTIVSCSDSRVPPEIVFDQGLGDLFIVRVAGNVINDAGLGSVEYSVDHLGTRLILVLGHQTRSRSHSKGRSRDDDKSEREARCRHAAGIHAHSQGQS